MSDYTEKCHRCGMFYQTRLGEYPSLCNICAAYMKEQREKRRMEVKEKQNGSID